MKSENPDRVITYFPAVNKFGVQRAPKRGAPFVGYFATLEEAMQARDAALDNNTSFKGIRD